MQLFCAPTNKMRTETIHKKSGKEKSQTINYRDKCAREWSQNLYTENENKNNGNKIQCSHLRIPYNKETDEQVITKRAHKKKDRERRFQRSLRIFIAFMKNAYLCIARRLNWMTRTTLELLFITPSSHCKHHLFSSANINLYARAKIEINGIEPKKLNVFHTTTTKKKE